MIETLFRLSTDYTKSSLIALGCKEERAWSFERMIKRDLEEFPIVYLGLLKDHKLFQDWLKLLDKRLKI